MLSVATTLFSAFFTYAGVANVVVIAAAAAAVVVVPDTHISTRW